MPNYKITKKLAIRYDMLKLLAILERLELKTNIAIKLTDCLKVNEK